jgi:Tol biopolymer transport system component
MNPCLVPDKPNVIYCTRFTNNLEGEIWRLNLELGIEETVLSQPGRSFSTPQVSPNGKWILCTGTSMTAKGVKNTDIFAIRTDGTGFTQLTYHPGNDLSAIWAPDGKSIYFLSERGTNDPKRETYNVWRMNFLLQ